MDSVTHVFVAGISNSGPDHWQSMWRSRMANSVWVEHSSWDAPVRDVWVKDLDDALRAIEGPKVLIAHSLGCTLVAEWASTYRDETVAGAFLVAMPDVSGANFPTTAVGFDSSRHVRLPFPTVVVASEDDPYGSPEHSAAGAEQLGARLVNVGRKGHINTASEVGDWLEGWSVFSDQFTR